jgi:hypothetical protein
LLQKAIVLAEMLKRFERDDHADAAVRYRNRKRVAFEVAQVRTGIRGLRMADSGCGNIDTDDRACGLRQQRRAVALATGDIEHVLVAHQLARQKITVPMFDSCLATEGRREALAIECKCLRWLRSWDYLAHGASPLMQRFQNGIASGFVRRS